MRFRVLGSIEVVDGERAVPIGGGRQRALLAALLLRPNEVVSSDRLVDELWGERPPETATKALHGLVSSLRKALEGDRTADTAPTVLVTRSSGYMLVVDARDLDAVEFERLLAAGRRELAAGDAAAAAETLRRALALWRGPAFADVADQEFARSEAQRLDDLRMQALEERIEADLLLGRSHEFVPELEVLVAREPLRERPRGLLMRALYASGRQADALEIYRQARQLFVEELGIEPGRSLQALEQAILRQDPALGAPEPIRPVSREPGRRRRRRFVLAAVAAFCTAAAAIAVVAFGRGQPPALAAVDPNHLGIVDPGSNKIVGEIAVGARPAAVAVGDGSVWVANAGSGTVARIDPRTRRVAPPIGTGEPSSSLAVTKDAVWVGNGSAGTVTRIDPASDQVVDTIPLRGPNPVVWDGVQSLAFGDGSLWVAVGPRALLRLDPRTGKKTWIPLGSAPLAVAFGAGAAWVITEDERLIRVDPSTDRPAESQSIGIGIGVAVGFGSVWVVNGQELSKFNSGTLVPEGEVPDGAYPFAVATGFGSVWSVDHTLGRPPATLYRTDPADISRRITIPFGSGSPADVAVGDGYVWVCVQ